MKKALVIFLLFCYKTSHAQVIPPLYVPYIPTESPRFDRNKAMADIIEQNRVRYESFTQEVDKIFARMVLSVDMLPSDKAFLQSEFSEARRAQDAELDENPVIIFKGPNTLSRFGEAFDKWALNAVLIQKYKTKYTRVLAWESFLREKNLLDKPYSNAKGLTGLTNRQALAILYGTDMTAFLDLGWE